MSDSSRHKSTQKRGNRGKSSQDARNQERTEKRLETKLHTPDSNGCCPHCGNPEYDNMFWCEECGTENTEP